MYRKKKRRCNNHSNFKKQCNQKNDENISCDKMLLNDIGIQEENVCRKEGNSSTSMEESLKIIGKNAENSNSTDKEHGMCDICKKSFTYERELRQHLTDHKEGKISFPAEKSVSCSATDRISGHRTKDAKPYQCDLCSKSYTQKSHLNRHFRIHDQDTPFQCELCSKAFSTKDKLKYHRILHTSERPFQCEFCQQTFSRQTNLNTHMVLHSEKHAFKCEKSFFRKQNLEQHMSIHNSGKEKLHCKICNASFSLMGNLKRHKRIHSGERYFCHYCEKSYSQQSSLTVHLRTHTSEKPYECDVCKKQFVSRSNLNSHYTLHTRK